MTISIPSRTPALDQGAPDTGGSELAAASDRFQRWMRNDALPLWSDAGWCAADGGFYEALRLDGAPETQATRRIRVQFRQIAVYAQAHLLGWSQDGLEKAVHAFAYVERVAWAPDGAPGWVSTVDAAGHVVDATRDAYDHAFALYGLAWLFRATGDLRVFRAIERTRLFIETSLTAPDDGWFESAGQRDGRRRQNPHMHAFEASLTLYEALQQERWLRWADDFLTLFWSRFYDRSTGAVREYFDARLQPLAADLQREEPGHGAEWAWLLSEHGRLTGARHDATIVNLRQRAQAAGAAAQAPFLINELDGGGRPLHAGRRCWPQTEAIRGGLAAGAPGREIAALSDALMDHYLAAPTPGGWRDAFDADDAAQPGPMPASTLYHLMGAAVALDTAVKGASIRKASDALDGVACPWEMAARDRSSPPQSRLPTPSGVGGRVGEVAEIQSQNAMAARRSAARRVTQAK